MKYLKKQLLLAIFMLSAGLFAAVSASAQTWSLANMETSSNANPCMNVSNGLGRCQCNSGYSYGVANLANCTMDGFIPGCWNPDTGKCNTCGQGGTVVLGQHSCFNSGQGNQGGTNPGIVGIVCGAEISGGPSAQCVSSGTTSGGRGTN